MNQKVVAIDHLSFPTRDAAALVAFYESIGVPVVDADAWRRGEKLVVSLLLGDSKLHVHTETMLEHVGEDWFVRADAAVPGSLDLCLEWKGGITALLSRLDRCAIPVVLGPVPRTGGRAGGTAQGVSVYIRDPDRNLIELISYDPADVQRFTGDGG